MSSVSMNRCLLPALAMFGIAVGAAQAQGRTSMSALSLPEAVAGFTFQTKTNYEATKPGLGYSARYESASLWADVYVYTRQRKDIPAAYDSSVSKAEHDNAALDISLAVGMGAYKSAKAIGRFQVPAKGKPRFDCSRYTIEMRERINDSVLCVTSRDGRFIKIRMSGPKGMLTDAKVRRFAGAWLKPVD